jgi:hypothetical protein
LINAFFDLPLPVSGSIIMTGMGLFAAGGMWFVRRRVLPRLRIGIEDSEYSGAMVQAVLVFYGLAVALIGVSVWQTYSDVSRIVTGEATSLASLYRDVSGYPEPIRTRLQSSLRDYVQDVIQVAWPLQRVGKVPTNGVVLLNKFQDILIRFEPATEGQKALHGETLRAYNVMITARRLRLDAVDAGLPGVLWGVIIGGAFIILTSSFFFKVEDLRLQMIQGVLLASFMGMVIFMIFALDRPFRGDLALTAEPYELIYDQLMKPAP